MRRPDHLGPKDTVGWWRAHPLAIATLLLGIAAFAVVAIAQRSIGDTPDPRVSVPGFAVTTIAGVASLVRREGAWLVVAAGIALAAASLVLGWFLLVAAVVAATLIVMSIVHALM